MFALLVVVATPNPPKLADFAAEVFPKLKPLEAGLAAVEVFPNENPLVKL